MSSSDGAVPTTRRGQVVLERRILRARDGLLGLHQRFCGDGQRVIVTHQAALIAQVQIERGQVEFPLAAGVVLAPERFLLVLPPRCVLPIRFRDASVHSDGVAGALELPDAAAQLVSCSLAEMPLDRVGALRAAAAPRLSALDADAGVAPAVVAARRCLHELLARPAPIQAAARRAGLAEGTLTRLFVRAYGLPPKQYCHRARLFAAVLHLLGGAAILDSALAAGWNDASRFYRQFRRLLGTTPGTYAAVRKRQDAAAPPPR